MDDDYDDVLDKKVVEVWKRNLADNPWTTKLEYIDWTCIDHIDRLMKYRAMNWYHPHSYVTPYYSDYYLSWRI